MTKWKCNRCDSACILDIGKGDYMDDPQICPFDPNIPEWKKLKSELKSEPNDEAQVDIIGGMLMSDMIEHPPHYCEGRQYEPLAVIEDWNLDFHKANALKYIARAGRKDNEIQDIKKAIYYLERYINVLEKKERIV